MKAWFSHHKCGSQWTSQVLQGVCDKVGLTHVTVDNHTTRINLQDLSKYDFVFVHNPVCDDVMNLLNKVDKAVHILRDPRDIVTSAYFSHLKTHPDWYPGISDQRSLLQSLIKEDGIDATIRFLDGWVLTQMAKWDYGRRNILSVKFEDLIDDELAVFTEMISFLGIDISGDDLREIVSKLEFKKLSEGREKGKEDKNSHYRMGVAGDWKNHFSQSNERYFNRKYRNILFKAEYETPFLVQVGANDGITQDLMHNRITAGWNGLLIEPIPVYFEKLKSNIPARPGIDFSNVAIKKDAGRQPIYFVDPDEIATKGLPVWANLIGSFSKEHIFRHVGKDVKIVSAEVETVPLSNLLESKGIKHIDLLYVDAEGCDFEVLQTIDFDKVFINEIVYEVKHMSKDDAAKCANMLSARGYKTYPFKDSSDNTNVIARFDVMHYLTSNRENLLHMLPKGSAGAELGVADGIFSEKILEIVRPRELHLIDVWEHLSKAEYGETNFGKFSSKEGQERNHETVKSRFDKQIKDGRVTLHKGYSDVEASKIPDGSLDWVYIDANHDYEHVLRDLEVCRLKVKDGGMICGHDFIDFNPLTNTKYGVKDAVNKFCKTHGWQIVNLTREGYPSYVLRKQQVSKRAIATVCDYRFLIGFEVMLKSLLINNPFIKNDGWDIVVITEDLDEQSLTTARAMYPNIKLHRVKAGKYQEINDMQRSDSRHGGAHGSFIKFEAFSLGEYNRVLFLDSDTLIVGNVFDLAYPAGDFCAVNELWIDQFNSGVMSIGSRYLGEKITNDLIQLARRTGPTEHVDQEIINIYFGKVVTLFPIGYNFLKLYHKDVFRNVPLAKHIRILHYVIQKPWQNIKGYIPIEQGSEFLYTYWWGVYQAPFNYENV